jgi:hypothetical protein
MMWAMNQDRRRVAQELDELKARLLAMGGWSRNDVCSTRPSSHSSTCREWATWRSRCCTKRTIDPARTEILMALSGAFYILQKN